jgi:di/tripeptidase
VGNPLHAISHAISAFAQAVPVEDSPRSSFNFGLIQGGTSINCIPGDARAKVDLRSEDPARIDRMAALLNQCVGRAVETENARTTGGRVAARVKEIGSRPGGDLPEGSAILEAVQAVDALLGLPGYLDCSSTDANIPLSLGLPAVSIGAGGQGGGAHSPGEWYHPEGREIGLQRVMLVLCQLLAAG